MGIIFAFASACLYAISILVSKVSVDKTKSPLAVGVIFQILAGLVSLLFFFFDKPEVINNNWTSWVLLLAACFGWASFTVFRFEAMKMLEVSVANLVGQLSLLFTFFASALLFREEVTVFKLAGIALLLVGNVVLIGKAWKNKTVNRKGVKLQILASVVYTIALMLDASNSANFSVSLYAFFAYFLGGLFMIPLARVSIKEIRSEIKTNWKSQLIMGIFSATGYYLLIKAFALAEKTVIVPVNNLGTVIVVILGIIFLKEIKDVKRKIFAAVLAFAGAVLLSI